MIPLVVASERGRAQTMTVAMQPWGCRTTTWQEDGKWNALERATVEGDSPVHDCLPKPSGILSSAGHEKSCVKLRGPSRKAKYSRETDSEPVP